MEILINKRKRFSYLILASLLSTTTVASATSIDYKATIITPEVIVRQENNLDSKEIDKLNIGTKITVKEVLDDWYRIELPLEQSEGWIFSDEAIISDKSYTESNLKKGIVTASVLNVRMGPSTDNSKTTQIYNGDIVTIINTSDEWYEVILSNNMKGWVHSDYIKITYNLPTGMINTNSIILKEKPEDTSIETIELKVNDTVYIKDYVDNWYNIITTNDVEGWIESKYITVYSSVTRAGMSRKAFSNIKPITKKYLGR